MKKLLGKTVCLLLRSHKWRRLRKAEHRPDRIPSEHRICARCGVTREVNQRKAKAAG